METYFVVASLIAAGFLGGTLNALFESEGFVLPKTQSLNDGRRIFRPGFLGNVLVGGIAAIVMAALYGPLGISNIRGTIQLDLRTLAGGLLSGIGGAKLLTQQANRWYDEATKKQTEDAIKNLTKLVAKKADDE
jgi:hypothetical protein